MASQINASNSGFGGIVSTGDSSGVLQLQTAGTTAITVDTSQNTTLAGKLTTASSGIQFSDASIQTAAASPYVLKNRIINGAMVIDQRNAGASITPTDGQFTVDRWQCWVDAASKLTAQQSTTVPTGYKNSLLITSTSAYSIASANQFSLLQPIEGLNVYDLGWGAAGALTVTLSFWARSSLTGTFGGWIRNSAGDRSYVFSYTISSANTWEYKTVTIAGDTSGTWLTTNGVGIYVGFSLGAGSSKVTTAGSWGSTAYYGVTGQQNLVATNGATFYITGVQLEQNTTATPFERRLYGQELINCQRYFQAQIIDIGNAAILSGNVTNGVSYYGSKTLQVAMRASPTLTWGTQWGVNGFAASAPTADWLGADGFRFYKAANATINGGYIFQAWNVSAEL